MDEAAKAALRATATSEGAATGAQNGFISWKPDVGDELIGIVARVEHQPSQIDGQPVRIVVVKDDEGQEISVWCSPVKLKDLVERLLPMPGQPFYLKREEDVTSKNGRAMRSYLGAVGDAPPPKAASEDAGF